MSVKLIPNGDVRKAEPSEANSLWWESLGDDPAFEIVFPFIRKRFVVVHIAGEDQALDPRVYINRGYGFREKDAETLRTGTHFTLIADVGFLGTIRRLRVDPATFPTRFEIHVARFFTRQSAQAHAAAIEPQAAGQLFDFGPLPRFWLKLPKLLPRRGAKNRLANYAASNYKLGAALAPAATAAEPSFWLTIVTPVYNAPPRYLDDLVRSFETQDEHGIELILSDDGSTSQETLQWFRRRAVQPNIQLLLNDRNGGIAAATNAGLGRASGTWVTFLDHDDVIAPYALKVIRRALQQNPAAEFLYTDELVVDDKLKPTGVMLKPRYDSVLLSGVNYINHFSIYRRTRLQEIGFLRTGYDGSQDYDLLLRYLEGLAENSILHLAYPAYWWRRSGHSYSRQFMDKATQAARRALVERFQRQGAKVEVKGALTDTLHRVVFDTDETVWPKISVVIPSKDNYTCISRILRDLFERTDYPDFEVIVIDNGSTDEAVLGLYDHYRHTFENFSAVVSAEPFNFSRSINKGMRQAGGEHFLLLNDDVEVIDAGWLKEMVSCLAYDRTGIVGAKLLYSNDTIQHAGVIIGFGGLAGHWYLNKPKNFGGPMNRLHVRNSVTCVTGAVMLISGECARTVGLWDEANFTVAYNDVDYCLRAHHAGFRIVWTPFACLYHHESVSRGSDKTGARKRRFDLEKDHLRQTYETGSFVDGALNPAYGRTQSTPDILPPQELTWPSMKNGLGGAGLNEDGMGP